MKDTFKAFSCIFLCAACGSSSGAESSASIDETFVLKGYFEKFFLQESNELSWTVGVCRWQMSPSPQYGEFLPGEDGIVFNQTRKITTVDPGANVHFHGTFGQMWPFECDDRGYAYSYLDVVLPLHADGENVVAEGEAELHADFPDGSSRTAALHVRFTVEGATLASFFRANGGAGAGFSASLNYSGASFTPLDRAPDTISFDPK